MPSSRAVWRAAQASHAAIQAPDQQRRPSFQEVQPTVRLVQQQFGPVERGMLLVEPLRELVDQNQGSVVKARCSTASGSTYGRISQRSTCLTG
jgi:hypothetical protein